MAETLVQRLRAKRQVYPAFGGGSVSVDYDGSFIEATSYISDDGRRLINPDGPEAAAEIERLSAEVERYRAALLAIDDTAKWHSSTEARDVCILARQALACKEGG